MARRDPESRDFYKGLAATVLVVAGFVAYAYWFKPGADEPDPKRERSTKNAPAVIATVGAIFAYMGGATQANAGLYKNNAAIKKTEAANQWNYFQSMSTKQSLAEV